MYFVYRVAECSTEIQKIDRYIDMIEREQHGEGGRGL